MEIATAQRGTKMIDVVGGIECCCKGMCGMCSARSLDWSWRGSVVSGIQAGHIAKARERYTFAADFEQREVDTRLVCKVERSGDLSDWQIAADNGSEKMGPGRYRCLFQMHCLVRWDLPVLLLGPS